MNLSIIHLTDMHMRTNNNFISDKATKIASACAGAINSDDIILLIISGDIAYSGQQKEYDEFQKMLNEITQYFQNKFNCSLHIVCTPGNHDCDFSDDQVIRECVLQSLAPQNEALPQKVNNIVDVQKTYERFAEQFNFSAVNKLVTSKEINAAIGKILIVCINTAWNSKKNENPGELFFPINYLPDINRNDYDLIITTYHHPSNWFHPDNALVFNENICNFSDLLLLGHEHRCGELRIFGNFGNCMIKNGKELQNTNSSDSNFSIYIIDETLSNLRTIEYTWSTNQDMYTRVNDFLQTFERNSSAIKSLIKPNEKTMEFLNDLEIPTHHFKVDQIQLSDIFCWPDLKHIASEYEKKSTVLTDCIFENIMSKQMTLIEGDNFSGKTSIGKQIYLECVKNNICCIYLLSDKISSFKEDGIENTIEQEIIFQYGFEKLEKIRQMPKEEKVLIIDSYQELQFAGDKRIKILKFIQNKFHKVILLSSFEVDIAVFFATMSDIQNDNFAIYKIMPFGNIKRKQFLEKWYNLGKEYAQPLDLDDVTQKIDTSMKIINNLIGQQNRIIPMYPFYLLNILQNLDSAANTTLHQSQYGYLYSTLIQKCLSSIPKIDIQTMNIFENALSLIGFKMLLQKTHAFCSEDIITLINQFKEDKKLPSLDEHLFLPRMQEAKILREDAHEWRFRYPYMFYYFVGKYIAYHLDDSEVISQLENMRNNLHNESYGNIIIFVCHFASSQKIIDDILLSSYCTFDNIKEFEFETKNLILSEANELIDEFLQNQSVGEEDDVPIENNNLLREKDELGIQDGTLDTNETDFEEVDEKERQTLQLYSALKTIIVLGQIIRNYPGDIDGKTKIEIVKEIHNLGMRLIQILFDVLGYIQEDIISNLVEHIKEETGENRKGIIIHEIKDIIEGILSNIINSVISTIAMSFGNEYSIGVAEEALSSKISGMLVNFEIQFNCLNKPQFTKAIEYYKYLNGNAQEYAGQILKSIVTKYLKYNKCGSNRQRDRLCSSFNIKKNLFSELSDQQNIVC